MLPQASGAAWHRLNMTQIILNPISSIQYWVLPADWNDAENTIEIYADGGAGATGLSTRSGGGGGGGGYVKATNMPLKAQIDAGNVFDLRYYSPGTYVNFAFGNFDYDSETFTPIVGIISGAQKGFNGIGVNGGAAGSGGYAQINTESSTVTSYTNGSGRNGGAGGNGRTATTAAGGGGGGAAGPNGNGGNGGTNTTTLGTTGRGGGGGNGGGAGSSVSALGGTAGTGAGAGGNGGAGGGTGANGSNGGAGTSIYSGGGGGGAGDGTGTRKGGDGGLYSGGGGGGASSTISTGGVGGSGIIIINYTPVVTSKGNFFFSF